MRGKIIQFLDANSSFRVVANAPGTWKKICLENGVVGYLNSKFTSTTPVYDTVERKSLMVTAPRAFVRDKSLLKKVAVVHKWDVLEVVDATLHRNQWVNVRIVSSAVPGYMGRTGYISKSLVSLDMSVRAPTVEVVDIKKATESGTADIDPQMLSKREMSEIKKDAYMEGNKDALITIVEYSDLECPFCIRHFQEGVAESLSQTYGSTVQYTFKNFRAVQHPGSEAKANALLCAGVLGGTEVYAAYYADILTGSGNRELFSVEKLTSLAVDIGLDEKKFDSCVESKEQLVRFEAETAEWTRLWVQGTPSTLIFNNTTGKYVLIPGAYPLEVFHKAIDGLLE